ncbi:acyl-CoA-like ligand-binding transcription factor [Actinomadura algeriensis]|uniref:AcrR family transcriptional regulator n=1 Tax=Actinomadura algeriensis TaxID=1679523 RepID=A0ABR9JQP5_9ACTN|nr:TetR family transcriptional regulator [Actinomadura algeriensis]MBE1532713.1 AcrR family transcriptional regulator [Actinomadura algeriensis]
MASGLRERKKARTRALIQATALRLFRERGYEATTVEQIARAAEVAHTTVFRYFPTKEDLVVSDDYDPVLFEALRTRPPDVPPLRALRDAMRATLEALPPDDLAAARDRAVLILDVPALRGAAFGNLFTTMRTLGDVLAERTGRAPDDRAVRTLTGAVFGVFLELMVRWTGDPSMNLPDAVDEALATLESGLASWT